MPLLRLQQAFWRYSLKHKKNLSSGNRAALLLLEECWQRNHFSSSTPCDELEFLVVDTETSALNVKDGELLSIGWVVIKNNSLLLDSAQHLLIRNTFSVGQSATIHTLRDCDLEEGLSERDIIGAFLRAAKGRVLVFHHAPLDLAFLNKLTRDYCSAPLLLPHIDTLRIEKIRFERKNLPIKQGDLTLGNCRKRYHLPDFTGHNALSDAAATAELLLAQLAYSDSCKLRNLSP